MVLFAGSKRRALARGVDAGDREEERAPSAARAVEPDPPAMGIDDRLRDEQSEPEPAAVVAECLEEPVEDALDVLGGYALPGVVHRELDLVADRADPHRDATALGGELERVADEVRDHLEDPRRVERCRADSRVPRARQPEPPRIRRRPARPP